jgi:ribosome-associated translation inhibitor RaiA
MQQPLQVTFHGLPVSETVEQDVRRAAAELEAEFPRIVSCRVSIELPHRHQQQGRRYRVRVDAAIPGVHVVAGRAAAEDPAHEDVHVALRHAFEAVRRQLEHSVGRRAHAG